ncbi:TetR/AcrR family transcriptional regulator [Cohnella silvisoli]|uniref:TetR/AcrR family transcriptional regulator n=1 Tax=Cohnella silvisoli TaxID=2873699 RepID=A0ABV1KTQ2_9BACL|nr:TetR/AcrR family transcriptional regulator [Cohnella silvisoli]MCD9022913.1 TetR/AcrR family transcriptional regulator [Cohnella silvisoli]
MSRDKIMYAAGAVFATRGYHRASMDDIAVEANVAKGTLYYHFPSKAQLFKALVTEWLTTVAEKIQESLNNDLPVDEQIRLVIRHHIDLYLDYGQMSHIVFNELTNGIEEDILQEIAVLREQHIRFVAGLLEEGHRAGIVRTVNFQLAASGTIGMLEGLCKHYLRQKDEGLREKIESFMHTVLFAGLFVNTTSS